MTPKQVKNIFDKLPSKRRKVLEGFLAGHTREKIMIDAGVPSNDALTGHLKELYKNFRIDTGWNDADDRRSGTRKLPLLISLFARCMPELISDRNPDVLDGVEKEEAITNKPTVTNPIESDTAPKSSIEAISWFLAYFDKASDQLQSPDIDVRIRAISTLGILAKCSQPAEHWTIMESLAAFIRAKAPRKKEEEAEELRFLIKLPKDIQAALTVIVQRDLNKNEGVLDLSNTDLRGAKFSKPNLHRVNLGGANLKGVRLCGAILSRANLQGANLQKTLLWKAELQWAKLYFADLQEASLHQANLQRADLRNTKLHKANFQRVNLHKACLRGVDLTLVKNLKSGQIASVDGDSMTRLPENLSLPKHWMQAMPLTSKDRLIKAAIELRNR